MSKTRGPVLIEMDEALPVGPDEAPAVPEAQEGRAMRAMAGFAARPASRLSRWFWRLLVVLVTLALSLWAWDFVVGLIARNAVLGYVASGLLAALGLVVLGLGLRELAGFSRLRRIDAIRRAAGAALAADDVAAAQKVSADLASLYAGRRDQEWALARLAERRGEVLDADAVIALAEAGLLSGLDGLARAEVERAASQVATVTAIVPLVFADVAVALIANLRMVRVVAEIYGGRPGILGSWRLMRSVLTHLLATGALAVADDLFATVAGGGVLSKLSRRFGEGVINGALTARVGIAAMEVCRPLPFAALARPSVAGLVKRALAGLFSAK
ncbi:MAG: YcjF family protein [Paracoccaceae bacterium]